MVVEFASVYHSVSVNFSSPLYGLAGSDSGAAARTTDGGVTWTPLSLGGSGSVSGFSERESISLPQKEDRIPKLGTAEQHGTVITGSIGL